MIKALVIGATGLVGRHLTLRLLDDPRFESVVVFSRRAIGMKHERLVEHIIDFDKPQSWHHLVTGDVLFSSLGSTLKKAGGKKQQFEVDYTYQYGFAKAASDHGVPTLVLVSSAGANPGSAFFYMRMKGQLERDVMKLPFRQLVLIRPGPLQGKRSETRRGEKAGVLLIRGLNRLGLFLRHKPIDGDLVARAMINASFGQRLGTDVYSLDELFVLAGHNVKTV